MKTAKNKQEGFLKRKEMYWHLLEWLVGRNFIPLIWTAGPSLIVNWTPCLYPGVPYSGGFPPRCKELPCLSPLLYI